MDMINEFAELLPEREALSSQSNVANVDQSFSGHVDISGGKNTVTLVSAPQSHIGQSNTSVDVSN